jgi:hypothetical protein
MAKQPHAKYAFDKERFSRNKAIIRNGKNEGQSTSPANLLADARRAGRY